MRRNKIQFSENLTKESKDVVIQHEVVKELKSKAHKSGDYFMNNSRFFRMNFESMLVISDCNKIYVLTGREFAIIDVSILNASKLIDKILLHKDFLEYTN